LTTRARTTNEHVDATNSVLHGALGTLLGGHLRRERRGLPRALEADVAGRGPGDDVSLVVGDRHDRVIERALDVRDAVYDVLALALSGPTASRAGGRTSHQAASRWAIGVGTGITCGPSSFQRRSSSAPCGYV